MEFAEKLILEACVCISNREYKKALSLLKKVEKIDKNNPEIYTRYSVIYELTRNEKKAKEMLKKALEIDPSYARAHYTLGIDYQNQGELIKAEKEFKTAIENYPKYKDPFRNEHLSEAHNNLGTIYYHLGKHKDAIREWRLAINYDRNNEEAGKNLTEFGNPSKKQNKESKFDYLIGRFGSLFKARRYVEAVNVLEQAYLINPNDSNLNYNLGLAYGYINKFNKAKKHLEIFLELAPKNKIVPKIKMLVEDIKFGRFK